MNFCTQKLKRRITAIFGFNRTALQATVEATFDVLRPVSEDRIISRRADCVRPPRSCDLTPLDYYLWYAIIDECYTDKLETIDVLKNNIREAISETQLDIIDVLQNWNDRVGYCMASRCSHLNENIFRY